MNDQKNRWSDVRTPSELWQLKEVKASVLTIIIGLAITIFGSLVLQSSTASMIVSFVGAIVILAAVEQIAKWVPKNRQQK